MLLDIPKIKPVSAQQNKPKILLVSYAFPPMQVQMSAAVCKPMASLTKLGYSVDVICADSFSPVLNTDTTLLPFINQYFSNIHRLNPEHYQAKILTKAPNRFNHIPDLMACLHESAFQHLMTIDLSQYKSIITFSPFHSVNPVLVKLKKYRKNIRWIAQFSDPWSGNPLEISKLNKLWNAWHEPKTIKTSNFLVHSSQYSLNLMLKKHPELHATKSCVIPHVFTKELYPKRPKLVNNKITLRYVGSLYGKRSPEPLFNALFKLLSKRKDLVDIIHVELVGHIEIEMLKTSAALSLPKGLVTNRANVNYLKSLELMYDADILLLIEADIRHNLFLASKFSDYLGANTPILGIVPPGSSEDILKELGAWYSMPTDINGIFSNLEKSIDYVLSKSPEPWCNTAIANQYEDIHAGKKFSTIIEQDN